MRLLLCSTRVGRAGHRVQAMQASRSLPADDYCVSWVAGDTIHRMMAVSKVLQTAATGIEGISCIVQDMTGTPAAKTNKHRDKG